MPLGVLQCVVMAVRAAGTILAAQQPSAAVSRHQQLHLFYAQQAIESRDQQTLLSPTAAGAGDRRLVPVTRREPLLLPKSVTDPAGCAEGCDCDGRQTAHSVGHDRPA